MSGCGSIRHCEYHCAARHVMFCKKFVHHRKGTAGTTVPFLWFIFRQKVEVGCYAGLTLRTYPFAHTSNPLYLILCFQQKHIFFVVFFLLHIEKGAVAKGKVLLQLLFLRSIDMLFGCSIPNRGPGLYENHATFNNLIE